MKEKTPILDLFLFAAGVAVLAICTGCATKTHHVDLAGMYANQTGTLAVGSIEIQSAPDGTESAMVSYEDDTSWFSDAKAHRIRVLLTGTNSTASAEGIVSNICNAFIMTAPALANGANVSTNGCACSPCKCSSCKCDPCKCDPCKCGKPAATALAEL